MLLNIVFGGDIGSIKSNQWFFETIYKYHFKLSLVPGNHDTFSEVSKYYNADFDRDAQELTYTRQDDYFKYIYLDTSSNSVSDKQLIWLKKELNTTKKIILFIHHPILKVNTPIDKEGAALKGRDEIKQLLEAIKNEVTIFCGHYHMDDTILNKNISQVLTPAASYQIKKQSEELEINMQTFGYRIITIENGNIESCVVLFENHQY